jgi:hypothetical protein
MPAVTNLNSFEGYSNGDLGSTRDVVGPDYGCRDGCNRLFRVLKYRYLGRYCSRHFDAVGGEMLGVSSGGSFRYAHRFVPERRWDSLAAVRTRVLLRGTRRAAATRSISTGRETSRHPFTGAEFASGLGLHADFIVFMVAKIRCVE